MRITLKRFCQKAIEWSHLRYRFLTVKTINYYAQKHSLFYLRLKEKAQTNVTPVRYVGEKQREDVIGFLPERYFTVLNNVSIIGASNVIIADGYLLYDMLINKKETYNITDKGLFRILNSPVHIGRKYIACFETKGKDISSGICLVGNFSGNLYHFVYEILSKWYLVEQVNVPSDVPILIDASARDIPQFRELLSIFSKEREIIYIEKWQLRKVGKLYYPSMVNMIPPNLKKMEYLVSEDVVFDLGAITFLRNNFVRYIGKSEFNTPKKFFISRKVSKWRQYNEEEIISVVKDYGYEVVYPETMTIKEQFMLFNNAENIVAASGAALTNIICCKPKTQVLILVSVRVDGTIYSTIAKSLGIELQYLTGKITNYNNVQSDFVIDCNQLKNALENG